VLELTDVDQGDVAAQAADVLRAGEVVVLPTETVYGIAALPTVTGATDRLFTLKGRSVDVPLAVLCSDADQALSLGEDPGGEASELARSAWPGPLTLVLRRKDGLGYELGEPTTTIGVRCPDHDLVRAVCREVGPIATTSANPHGKPTPATAPEVIDFFGDDLGLVIDGGRCTGEPSTVVDVTGRDRSTWRILRHGSYRIRKMEEK
jgi:tRNA threonylcarbamoyl adenosine modification protein (Sua5/YciO/YrdC/YwlC family)